MLAAVFENGSAQVGAKTTSSASEEFIRGWFNGVSDGIDDIEI